MSSKIYSKPKEKYEKFIIGTDEFGKSLYFTCNPSKLQNLYGVNPEAPYFLTPVFFDKNVLEKYYSSPEEYNVDDGWLSNGKWGINIDNNAKNCVMVYLGDLGRLPYKEQQYWKLHNIPKGNISETSFRRDFQAKFSSPIEPALFFKEKFVLFNKKWKEKFGWDLFKPLNKGDKHHWKTLRIPKQNSQKEFDENILSLIKILIDSLNRSKMEGEVGHLKGESSISLLRRYLEEKHSLYSQEMVSFLKSIQSLRSRGSAHRKAEEFPKFYDKYNKGNFSKTFKEIIINVIKTLNTIENRILK